MKTLKENSLWSDDPNKGVSKEEFMNSTTFLGDAFWINILGFSGLYNKNKKFAALHAYLTQVSMDQLKALAETEEEVAISVTGSTPDIMMVIKLLSDEDRLRSTVVRELSRFLIKLKTKRIDTVDEEWLRTLMKKIPFAKVKTSPKLKPIVMEFLNSERKLNDTLDAFYKYCRITGICKEYMMMYRRMMKFKTEGDETTNESVRLSFKDYLDLTE